MLNHLSFISLFFVFFYSTSPSQITTNRFHPNFKNEKLNVTPLNIDNLIGMTKSEAMPIISKYQFHDVSTSGYPFIKEVIEVTDVERFNSRAATYLFIDSSDHICRIHYKTATGKITLKEAESFASSISTKFGAPNRQSDNQWDFYVWEKNNNEYFMMWQKGLGDVRPAYLITTKEYKSRIINYLRDNPWPNDGIFTPIPE